MHFLTTKNCLLLTFLLLTAAQGCARHVFPPVSGFVPSMIDSSPLEGKVIVIDPGHGGIEQGAIGVHGLKESEVNLGVALYLWGLLKNAGAQPLLTRSADTSIFTAPEFILKEDLQARCDISDENNADLFISIHHNSDIKNRKRNNLSIFYKMSDPGQSKDIAREMMRDLSTSLQSINADIRPGNYHVLRNTAAPAILGEASFMSNKKNETMLSYHRVLRSEAEGYFKGIVNYYKKGVPEIIETNVKEPPAESPRPHISARIHSGSDHAPIEPSSIKVTLDGTPVRDFSFAENNLISFVPPKPLANGRHGYCISARNTSGNISGNECTSFEIALPPGNITVSPIFSVIPADGMSVTPVDVEVIDTLNRPVIDGTPVHITVTGGTCVDTTVSTRGGNARTFLVSDERPKKITVTASAGTVHASCSITFGPSQKALFMATLRNPSGIPVSHAHVIRDNVQVGLSDDNGFVFDTAEADGKVSYSITKKGFHPLSLFTELSPGSLTVENLLLTPIDNGVFFEKKIILDPVSLSHKTTSIIDELDKMINKAGGSVVTTWEKGPEPGAYQRIVKAQREDADLFLTVDMTKDELSVGYYFKSEPGIDLASRLCGKIEKNNSGSSRKCRPVTSTHQVIIHTAMPAVWISLPSSLEIPAKTAAGSIYEALAEFFRNYR